MLYFSFFTDDVMIIIITLNIVWFVVFMIYGLLIYLWVKSNNKKDPSLIKGRSLSISSGSEIDSDFEADSGVHEQILGSDVHDNMPDQWTVNPSYPNRINLSSFRSNMYESIRSRVVRRSSKASDVHNGSDVLESQALLNANAGDKIGKVNPAFEAEELHPDYLRETMSKITDIQSTEEPIPQSSEDAPLSLISFKMENETVQYSCPIGDLSDATRKRPEVCYSASSSNGLDIPEEMWQQISWKDYRNFRRTSESPAGPSTGNDYFQSFVTPGGSLHTDIPSVQSSAEINELINLGGNSDDECPTALETWFPVQSKDYSDTEIISFKSDPDDNAVAKSLGTRDHPKVLIPITVPLPSVPPAVDELSINDPKHKYESIVVNGRSNNRLVDLSQVSEAQITGKVNDQHKANGPTVTSSGGDHVCIMIEEENNEGKDKENQNESKASVVHLMSAPYLRGEPSSMSALMSLETLDQPNDKYNTKKSELNVTVNADPEDFGILKIKDTDDVNESEEIRDMGKCSSNRHYEKLNTSDENPQYAELFPPNMQDILSELSDSAENILEFSRAEMEIRSEPDGGYTADDYDNDTSEYL